MENIIDCHVHIYPDKIAEKASKSIGRFYDMPMKYDGTAVVIKHLCSENNISKCVINSVATTPEQVKSINNFIADSVLKSGGLFAGLLTLHHDMSETEIAAEIDRAEDLGLLGIKLHPDFQKFEIDNKRAYKIYDAAVGRLPILFHAGDSRFNYSNPKKLAAVLDDFPHLTAIAAHFGGWSEWEDGVQFLAGRDNLYVDTSSSFYSMTEEKALDTIRTFGAEKVLFGTDYPMWDVKNELDFFNRLPLSEDERRMILSENVTRLLKL